MYLEINKIKKTFLIFFALLIFGFSVSTFAEDRSNGSKNIFLDSDQDGLSDQEEITYGTDPKKSDTDGDGYSDGTEIKSGYDPLKPAPGDKIVNNNGNKKDITQTINSATDKNKIENLIDENSADTDTNLTEQLSVKLASMISDNDNSETSNITINDIDTIIDEATSDETTFSELPKIDESKIKTKKQKYSKLSEKKRKQKRQKDDEEYLSAVFYIVANNLPREITTKNDLNAFSNEIVSKASSLVSNTKKGMSYFNDLANRGSKILKQLENIEVPKDMFQTHVRGIQLATYAISLKDTVKIDSNDPLASLLSLSNAQNLITLTSDFMDDIQSEMNNLGLTNMLSEQNNEKEN